MQDHILSRWGKVVVQGIRADHKVAIKRDRERDRSYKEDFYWRMEDIGVWGDKRV